MSSYLLADVLHLYVCSSFVSRGNPISSLDQASGSVRLVITLILPTVNFDCWSVCLRVVGLFGCCDIVDTSGPNQGNRISPLQGGGPAASKIADFKQAMLEEGVLR
jgi:hypothetical protein